MAGTTLEVKYQDAEVQDMARRLGSALGRVNFRPLMEVIGAHLVSVTQMRFEKGKGPGGVAWPVSRRAQQDGGKTLQLSRRLYDSIANSSDVRSDTRVEIGSNVKYAAIHQFGGTIGPRVIEARRGKALFIPGIGFRRRVNHPGSAMPARPYLGIDSQDESLLLDVTDRWLKQTLGQLL
ncbi:MAG: phage virion morphogenesis protein [Desulfovibrionaceae bacterium]